MSNSPVLWGPNNISNNLQNGVALANGALLSFNGAKNYIANSSIQSNATTGYSLGTIGTLTNGLPTGTPTFGSGANSNLSVSPTAAGVGIGGTYSLQLAQASGATTAGNMLAYGPFTIDTEDQAKVMQVSGYYSVPTNGLTATGLSGTSSNNIAFAVYDATNSVWLTSAGNFNFVQSTGVGRFTGTCQTGATTASMYLVIYFPTATTGATTFYLRDLYLGPQIAPTGPAMTDWQAFTPTGSWSTNATYTGYQRLVGDTREVQIDIALTGAPSGTLTLNTYNSESIDTTKISSIAPGALFGTGTANTGTYYNLEAYYASTTTVGVYYQNGTSGSMAAVTATAPTTWASGNTLSFTFRYPVVGKSSNTNLSSDTDTRIVAMQVSQNTPTATVTSSFSLLKFTATPLLDTHGGFSTSTGGYTCPVTGSYRITISADLNGTYANTNYAQVALGVNSTTASTYSGTQIAGAAEGILIPTLTVTYYCNAGTVLYPLVTSTGTSVTIGGNATVNFFMVERLSGPAVVAATESVNMNYTTSSALTIGTTLTTLALGTKNFDSHNAYNTTTGVYTVPVSGKYRVSATVTTAAVNLTTAQIFSAQLQKNGTGFITTQIPGNGASSISYCNDVSQTVSCNTGDTISLAALANTATTTYASSGATVLSLERIGN